MHYSGSVYRPPSEAYSLIVQVTLGCSHNKCAFCNMYKDKTFSICPIDQVMEDLAWARQAYPRIEKVFLADGDALVLPTDKLIAIMKKCYEKFPNLNRIGAYATPADLVRKTPEELKRLREAGLAIVYMGIESGDDDVLKLVDKGTTAALTIEAGKKALAAGMKLSTMILLGLGGQERTKEHALHTAQVVSAINPTMLSALSLIIPHEVPLYQDVVEGTFTPLTARGFLKELDMILRHTEMTKPCIFRSNHVSNLLPVGGTLPMDKEKMLAALERYIPQVDDTLPLLNDNGNF